LQKIVAAILIFAFLGQSFNQYWYYLGYLVEKKEYMARCENKALPQMHCNGKCQLMKKIREQQEKERGSAPELKLAAKSEVLPPVTELIVPAFVENVDRQFFPSYRAILPKGQPSLLFRPPAIC
jgi:hypothetical protein